MFTMNEKEEFVYTNDTDSFIEEQYPDIKHIMRSVDEDIEGEQCPECNSFHTHYCEQVSEMAATDIYRCLDCNWGWARYNGLLFE